MRNICVINFCQGDGSAYKAKAFKQNNYIWQTLHVKKIYVKNTLLLGIITFSVISSDNCISPSDCHIVFTSIAETSCTVPGIFLQQ